LEHKGKEYLSVSKWSYKLIYRIGDNEARIIEIVHMSRNITVIEEAG
jgi:hypothetical protein